MIRKIYAGEKDVTLDLYPKGILNNQYVTILNPESDLAEKVSKAKDKKIDLVDDYLFVYGLNWKNF